MAMTMTEIEAIPSRELAMSMWVSNENLTTLIDVETYRIKSYQCTKHDILALLDEEPDESTPKDLFS
jgi:hypothetical protein